MGAVKPMTFMIITTAIGGGIPKKGDANNVFTTKQYLASIEEQFKSTFKANASTHNENAHYQV